MTLVSPSILSADMMKIKKELCSLEEAGADMIHIDVMDGHFVPNLTLGPFFIEQIKKNSSLPLDVHLMIDNPHLYIDDYIDSGSDMLTIHIECPLHHQGLLSAIKKKGARAGIALNPGTHENAIEYLMKDLDIVLVMAVNPGFCGQDFITGIEGKVKRIKKMMDLSLRKDVLLSVDGGINEKTAAMLKSAGANCLVSGSFIFGSKDYKKTIESLKKP